MALKAIFDRNRPSMSSPYRLRLRALNRSLFALILSLHAFVAGLALGARLGIGVRGGGAPRPGAGEG